MLEMCHNPSMMLATDDWGDGGRGSSATPLSSLQWPALSQHCLKSWSHRGRAHWGSSVNDGKPTIQRPFSAAAGPRSENESSLRGAS